MPRFNITIKGIVTIDANSKEDAQKIFDDMDVIAFTRGEPEGPIILKYKRDYPIDVSDWGEMEER